MPKHNYPKERASTGPRPTAGAPKKLLEQVRLTVSLDKEQADWLKTQGVPSKIIRNLIDEGKEKMSQYQNQVEFLKSEFAELSQMDAHEAARKILAVSHFGSAAGFDAAKAVGFPCEAVQIQEGDEVVSPPNHWINAPEYSLVIRDGKIIGLTK